MLSFDHVLFALYSEWVRGQLDDPECVLLRGHDGA